MPDTINGLPQSLQGLALPTETQSSSSSELGQSDFLELLVTQVQNQDPLNPSDSGDFLAQLAQFGTVNGITELQSSFSSLAAQLQSNQALQASTLVGRTVTVPGDTAAFQQGSNFQGAVDLSSPVDNLTVNVSDAAGQLVQQINLGPQSAGLVRFEWNGLNTANQQVPSGNYQFSAQGTLGGNVESFSTLISANVESVTLSNSGGSPLLNLGATGTFSISDISEVL